MELLLNGAGELVINYTEKNEVLNVVFASDLTSKISLWESQAAETRGKIWNKEDLPSVKEDQTGEHLNILTMHLWGLVWAALPQVLREMAGVIGRPLLIIFDNVEWLLRLEKVPENWQSKYRSYVQERQKGNLRNWRLVGPTLVPEKVME